MSDLFGDLQQPTRVELCELDIDGRLLDLWAELVGVEEWSTESVAVFVRAAYATGYIDALSEPRRGSLLRDHGYDLPRRRRTR